VIQALVLAFVAAPMIIRAIFRLRQSDELIKTAPSVSWGK